MAIGEISWRKSRESCLTEPVRELRRGCGAAKMEPAAAGPGPLIVNNKQPQPPPPPPPTTAQPPPGAPRAAGGLLPGGKAREFNRNQRKDSEVSGRGARLLLGGWQRGSRGRGSFRAQPGLPGGLTGGLAAVILRRTTPLGRLAAPAAPGREARSPATDSSAARGKVREPGTARLLPGVWPEAQPRGQSRWSALGPSSFPAPNRGRAVGDASWPRRDPREFGGCLEQGLSL